jgi:hypothetical protein
MGPDGSRWRECAPPQARGVRDLSGSRARVDASQRNESFAGGPLLARRTATARRKAPEGPGSRRAIRAAKKLRLTVPAAWSQAARVQRESRSRGGVPFAWRDWCTSAPSRPSTVARRGPSTSESFAGILRCQRRRAGVVSPGLCVSARSGAQLRGAAYGLPPSNRGAELPPRVTADGTFVVLTTAQDILDLGTPPGAEQVYRLERSSGSMVLVSRTTTGAPPAASSSRSSTSSSGARRSQAKDSSPSSPRPPATSLPMRTAPCPTFSAPASYSARRRTRSSRSSTRRRLRSRRSG